MADSGDETPVNDMDGIPPVASENTGYRELQIDDDLRDSYLS